MKGNFNARALSGVLCETKDSKPQVAIEFEFSETGEKIGWYGQLSTDKSIPFTLKSLRNAGFLGTDLSEIAFDGRECTLVIEEEEYEDESGTHTRSKVKYVNALGSGVAVKAPMDASKAKQFAATLKGQFLALDQASGVKTAPTPTTSAKSASKPPSNRAPASSGDPRPTPPPADDMPF